MNESLRALACAALLCSGSACFVDADGPTDEPGVSTTTGTTDGDSGDGDGNGEPEPPPAPGEVTDVRLIPGAGYQVVLARGPAGRLLVGANHTGDLAVDGIELPAPADRGFVALELAPDSSVRWATPFAVTGDFDLHAAATTPSGDGILVGDFTGRLSVGDVTLESADAARGFAIVLDGDDGTPGVFATFEGQCRASIGSVAVAPDGDVFLYGSRDCQATLGRWNPDGTTEWTVALPGATADDRVPMALDANGGPVIAGQFRGTLELGGDVLHASGTDWFIATFSGRGEPRRGRLYNVERDLYRTELAVAGDEIVFAAPSQGGSVFVGDRFVHSVGHRVGRNDDLFVTSFSRSDDAASVRTFHGAGPVAPMALAVDAEDGLALVAACSGDIETVPLTACPKGRNAVLMYFDAGARFPRWSAPLSSANGFVRADAVVADDDSLIVAGDLTGDARIGAVDVSGRALFIARFAAGAAAPEAPVGPAPRIDSVSAAPEALDSQQVRQGGTLSLRVEGEHLGGTTGAILGDLPARLVAVDDAAVELTVLIPHGHPLGDLALHVVSPGRTTSHEAAATVTPVVAAPDGKRDAAGTYDDPISLTQDRWSGLVGAGSTLEIASGNHECRESIFLPRGARVVGQQDATISLVDASIHASYGFAGIVEIRDLVIVGDHTAIAVGAPARISDVDLTGGAGISISPFGVADIERLRFRGGSAMFIAGGTARITDSVLDASETAISMLSGSLSVDSTYLSGREAAVIGENAGADRPTATIVNSVIVGGEVGIDTTEATVRVENTTIESAADSPAHVGVKARGATVSVTGGSIEGWAIGADLFPLSDLPAKPASVATFTNAQISATAVGVRLYGTGSDSQLAVTGSSLLASSGPALRIAGELGSLDLGTPERPGANSLRSQQGVALLDTRSEPGVPVRARGTELNGQRLDGPQLGPLLVPDVLEIQGPNEVRF